MPKGTDESFARKLYDNLSKNSKFIATSREKVLVCLILVIVSRCLELTSANPLLVGFGVLFFCRACTSFR